MALFILPRPAAHACPAACSEETALLQRLHELNPALMRRLCHRLFFAVNKCDAVSHTTPLTNRVPAATNCGGGAASASGNSVPCPCAAPACHLPAGW